MKLKRIGKLLIGCSAVAVLVSCSNQTEDAFDVSKNISLYSRESGSGTRECFFEGIGYADVKKEDKWETGVTVSSQSSNANIMSAVGEDVYGLGYCALDSLSSVTTIKGLSFEGITASKTTVLDGTYKLSRNFNYVIRGDYEATSDKKLATEAFIKFMSSKEGLTAISSAGGIVSTDGAKAWSELDDSYDGLKSKSVELLTCGSTSVKKVLDKLIAAFKGTYTGVSIVTSQTGSGDAVKGVTTLNLNNTSYDIGFLSREINDSEKANIVEANVHGAMCKDAVIPVINSNNKTIESTTAAQLKSIYKGEKKVWSDLVA